MVLLLMLCLTCFTSKGCEVQRPTGNQWSGDADSGRQAHSVHVGAPLASRDPGTASSRACALEAHTQIRISERNICLSLLSLPPSNYHI